MTFVVDASILVAWAFDEVNAVASEARERMHREAAAASALGWFEVRNALTQNDGYEARLFQVHNSINIYRPHG